MFKHWHDKQLDKDSRVALLMILLGLIVLAALWILYFLGYLPDQPGSGAQ